VIAHPRFQKGNLSTAFLVEEYPKGFQGHQLTPATRQELLAATAFLFAKRDARNRHWIRGGDGASAVGGEVHAPVPATWDLYVQVGKETEAARVQVSRPSEGTEDVLRITLDDQAAAGPCTLRAQWDLESTLFEGTLVDEGTGASRTFTSQYQGPIPLGMRIQHYGTKVCVCWDLGL
jgi:propionyl-CoA carboxylase alpha chain